MEEVIPAYFEEGSEMRGARGLSIIENMLRGSVVPFAVQYERRGQRKGLEKGLERAARRSGACTCAWRAHALGEECRSA